MYEAIDIYDLEAIFDSPVNKKYTKSIAKIDPKIQDFVLHLQTIDEDIKNVVLSKLFKYLQNLEPHPPIDDVIKSGILPLLVADLTSKNFLMQLYAAQLISFIIKWDASSIKDIVEAGAIISLIELLKLKEQDAQSFAVQILSRIAAEKTYSDLFIQEEIIGPLFNSINPFVPIDFAQNVTAIIAHLCYSFNDETPLDDARLLLVGLKRLPNLNSDDSIFNITLIIEIFLEAGPKCTELLIDFGLFKLVVDNLRNSDEEVNVFAYECFIDFISKDHKDIRHLIDCGILPITMEIFSISDVQVKKLMITFLSKIIAAGEKSQIDDIIDANLVPLLISLKKDDDKKDLEIQRKTLEILYHILELENFDHAMILFYQNFVPCICSFLDHEDLDLKNIALFCIKTLLENLSEFSYCVCK
uniref:Uncharacterized protein n=1 Tax=Panagrolaimus sp. ES5 TaxID=591445 RepID=A0AC34FA04_9BILA